MSKGEAEILLLRGSIEKALDGGGGEQEVSDMLKALEGAGVTLELLRSTKIGVTVANVRKKFPSGAAGNLAKDLIAKWRDLVPAKTDGMSRSSTGLSNASTSSTVSAGEIAATLSKLTTVGATANARAAAESAAAAAAAAAYEQNNTTSGDPRYMELPAHRKKIVDLLAEKLKMSTTDANVVAAEFMACTIENGIHEMFDSDTDKSNYATKARSLVFNLKSNETLRRNIIDGILDAELVVHLTPQQLASEEKVKEIEKAKEDATAERRGDWIKIARDQIMKDNGLDPNKGGEFTCKKCKGTKTSHYAMQTRSADEPMTVFVCCLGCGNRWRTQ